ncbi:hypothetical protein LCGC14_2308930 [marine sediment metagenome]|uniref:DUF2796 domain-containing protein n=2 Tax=root TaxID=1 RepID=A0A7V1GDW1_9GAMM|nr:DUF2796 domain-containing protein [Pseudoalteromonas prydzensis]HEA16311.1 DUF2796 domain-containing protein [Pseudoalteromonas prydzensis]
MKNTLLFVMLLTLTLSFTTAAYGHVHGQGELFVSQHKQTWLLQFVLPSADLLGFEHTPKSDSEHQAIQQLAARFADHTQIIAFNEACQLDSIKHSLQTPSQHTEQANAHHDIELEYYFTCPNTVDQVSVLLFKWATSLTHIKAQWLNQQGQGMQKLTAAQPTITWSF